MLITYLPNLYIYLYISVQQCLQIFILKFVRFIIKQTIKTTYTYQLAASHTKRGREDEGDELDNMANCLMLIIKVGEISETNPLKESGSFRCKTCNREFSSFQALGGHRASHKRSTKLKVIDLSNHPMKPRMHLCPICGLEFGIGQALGGHMRKHRASIVDHKLPILKKSRDAERFNLCLDLNLTPYENDLKLNLRTHVLF